MAKAKPKETMMRPWVTAIVAIIWTLSAVGVFICLKIHPKATTTATLRVSEVSFHTTAMHLFSTSDQDELGITRFKYLAISGHIRMPGKGGERTRMVLSGESHATCMFTRVQAGAVELSPGTEIDLSWTGTADAPSLGLATDQPIRGTLTSQPKGKDIAPGFTCTGVAVDGVPTPGMVSGVLSASGGDAVTFATDTDSRIDFEPATKIVLRDTQIPVVGDLLFWRIDPKSSDYKTVLLAPLKDKKNDIKFDSPAKTVTLRDSDLVEIRSGKELWIRTLAVDNGIELDVQGTVSDVRTGPGISALRTRMPPLLDDLLNAKGILALIPSIAAAIIGVLEKLKILPKL